MQAMGRCFVRYINGSYRRSGTLWEGRFKSALIDSEGYLLTCSRYIELNPVRAGMVRMPGEYRWSSFHGNALGAVVKYLTPHAVYRGLGNDDVERRQAYLGLFEVHIDDSDLSMIRKSTQQCTIIGSSRFQDEIQKMLSRRVMKHQHGGDRKSESYKAESSVLTP